MDVKTYLGSAIGMLYDKNESCYWIYSSRNIYRLDISNEDKEVWKLYLENKNYKEAYEIC